MRVLFGLFLAITFLCGAFTVVPKATGQSAPSPNSMPPSSPVGSAAQLTANQLIQPKELAAALRSSTSPKPLLLQVGFRVLYVQAHIPGSEYMGAASTAEGLQQLRARVEKLPRNEAIVLYCGCCPWTHCPNVQAAYQQVHSMGFTNVKVLYIAHDFGTDWVSKGYPVAAGQ
jgi:thiosulfate/3-mercaptopyruvate sulfurtransferase